MNRHFPAKHAKYSNFHIIKADQLFTRNTLNAPWLPTNRQFQWTGNGHPQLLLAELGKPSPNIDLLHTTGSNGRAETIFTVWPWPLTYDLDLQSQASQGLGWPSCQKSRSKVKRFKQESAHRQMDGHTHGRYQTYYRPCYEVGNKNYSMDSNQILSDDKDLQVLLLDGPKMKNAL